MGRKTGVVLSYLLIVFEALSTLLITPFVIRTLGQAEYGVYKLAAAVNAYLLLLDLGLGNAITRFVAKYRATEDKVKERTFLGVVTIYYFVIALVALLAGTVLVAIFPTVFAKGLSNDEILLGQKLLSIIMINSAVTLGTSPYANVLIGHEKFIISKGAAIIQIILRMALTIAALRLGFKSIGIVCVNLVLTIICRTFYVYYVLFIMKIRPQLKGITKTFVKEIVAYSSLILLQMIATQLNSTVDQILIGSLVQGSAVIIAVYGVGTQIVQYFQSFGSAFNGVLMPGVVRLVENNADSKTLTREMTRVGRMLFLILSPIWVCFLLQGKQFVALWAGQENSQAYYVTIILMTAQLFIMTESIGSQILWARNEHKEQAYLKLGVVLLNIILTIFLIKWNALIGATIGTLISLFVGDIVVMNFIFKKKIGFSVANYYKDLLSGIWASLALTFVAGIILNQILTSLNWFNFFAKVSIMVIVYLASVYMIGINKDEKRMINNILRKIRRKLHFGE